MQKKPEKEVVEQVELKLIDPPDGHVRMEIPEREIFELSESIKEVGLIQAIVIRPVKKRYEVVVGHRRYLAMKRLAYPTIKTEIKVLTDKEAAILRATENLQRKDLTPIEEAAIYVDLYEEKGFTVKMIAEKMGRAGTHIERKMKLLKLDPVIQKAIHEGKMTETVARVLNKIQDKKELYRHVEMAIEHGVTEKIALMWTDDLRKGLQYINNRSDEGGRQPVDLAPEKYYTPCQICEGPMEYKEIVVIKICPGCYDSIRKSIK
ncbi:Nucleoid occlusion protein [subsurface metagenome]